MSARERATRLAVVALASLAVAVSMPAAVARAAPPTDDETALLERYAPIVTIRTHTSQCGDGERFLPVAVDVILGRDDVVLRDEAGDVVAEAPTVADLRPGEPDLWIDMPGNALDPGCTYEEWFDTLGAEATIYGRITSDEDHVVAQYWFFWVYNQWNDVHEGDWEMVQLDFGPTDVAGALETGPVTYAYAQHEGSQYATVGDNDEVLELVDGTHPVVYASEGSHASYFSSSRWFGKSGATGFGCDDTTAPTDQLRPALVVLPTGEVPTDGPFAWLAYEGHWGQKAPSFDNGPTGPVTKSQWDHPVEWVRDEGRDGAIALPFAETRPTESFCGLSEWGSEQFNKLLDQPIVTLTVLALGVALVVLVVRRSSQGLLGRAARRWLGSARQLAIVGAVLLAGLVGSVVLVAVVADLTQLGLYIDTIGASSPWVLPIVAAVSSLVVVPVYAWVTAATVSSADGAPTARRALAAPFVGRGPAIVPTIVLVLVIAVGLVFWPLLILASRWLVAPVIASRGEMSPKQALGRSHRLVMGHGLRAAGLLVTLLLVAASAGVVGALVLLLTSASFLVASIVTGLVAIVLVPYIALVIVGFHDDLAAGRAAFVPTAG